VPDARTEIGCEVPLSCTILLFLLLALQVLKKLRDPQRNQTDQNVDDKQVKIICSFIEFKQIKGVQDRF
jgi:hypothetical protein